MTAKLHDLEVDDYLASSVTIDDRDSEREMIEWSASLAYWNQLVASALEDRLSAQVEEKRTKGRLAVRCRLEITADLKAEIEFDAKGKPKLAKTPTEPMVEAAVSNHPELHAAQDAVIRTEVVYQKMRGIVDAVAGKGDMLRSLSRRILAEMGNDPVVRDKWRGERALRQQDEDIELE